MSYARHRRAMKRQVPRYLCTNKLQHLQQLWLDDYDANRGYGLTRVGFFAHYDLNGNRLSLEPEGFQIFEYKVRYRTHTKIGNAFLLSKVYTTLSSAIYWLNTFVYQSDYLHHRDFVIKNSCRVSNRLLSQADQFKGDISNPTIEQLYRTRRIKHHDNLIK